MNESNADTKYIEVVVKIGSSIQITKEVSLTVVERAGRRIKIGITAPPAIKVLRHELLGTDNAKAD